MGAGDTCAKTPTFEPWKHRTEQWFAPVHYSRPRGMFPIEAQGLTTPASERRHWEQSSSEVQDRLIAGPVLRYRWELPINARRPAQLPAERPAYLVTSVLHRIIAGGIAGRPVYRVLSAVPLPFLIALGKAFWGALRLGDCAELMARAFFASGTVPPLGLPSAPIGNQQARGKMQQVHSSASGQKVRGGSREIRTSPRAVPWPYLASRAPCCSGIC